MRKPKTKALLLVSLVFNLSLLGYFKYAGFLARRFASVAGALGLHWTPSELEIALPIGISFYTFMTISYTIDEYLRRAAPARSFLDYALYVTFFILYDLIMFGFAAFAIQRIIDTRYAVFSRSVGGVILIGLGVWMLAR